MSHHLALDLGAESGRAILGKLENDLLELREIHRFANMPVQLPSGLHWDVLYLWREIQTGIALAAAYSPLNSLGLDTWGVDFALLDRRGELLANPHHYRDPRTNGMMEEAFRRVPREQIFAQTGAQFLQINTLYQLLALARQKSPLLDTAQTFLTIPDLFNYWLSGEICAEFTNATTTQCLNPIHREWAFSLLEALDIPTRLLPRICQPGTILGTLRPAVSATTQAGSVPVIAPACHDTGSAVVAIPAESADFAWISSGTWSIMGVEITNPCLDERALLCNFTNEGGVENTWRLSKNIMGLWLVQECKRVWDISYDEITHLAAQAQPFLAVIDPDAPIFFSPGDMPHKISAFCAESGQPAPQTRGEIVRVVLESLALKYRYTLEQLRTLTGKPLETIHIIGGGTKNRLLNQLTANCTGCTVITGPVEATAAGNLLMQAIAQGHLDSLAQARSIVRRSFKLETYQPAGRDGWDAAYEKLLSLLKDSA